MILVALIEVLLSSQNSRRAHRLMCARQLKGAFNIRNTHTLTESAPIGEVLLLVNTDVILSWQPEIECAPSIE